MMKSIFRHPAHPLVFLTAGFLLGAILSSVTLDADASDFGVGASPPVSDFGVSAGPKTQFGVGASSIPPSDREEISPDELARELGLPLDDNGSFEGGNGLSKTIPYTRVVAPDHFKDFRVNIDIFRRSMNRPVLGEFRDEYTEILVPDAGTLTPDARTAKAEKRFNILAHKEFAVASLDGVPFKAYIISGALEEKVPTVVRDANGEPILDPSTGEEITRLEFKSTPPGNYRLDPIAYDLKLKASDGTTVKSPVVFPWIRSHAYHDSQMYWALWIKGGYFLHSTPHYGELGRPASMGCIRQSFPDAQEIFKLVVDDGMSAMIRIHPLGAKVSVSRLREIIADPNYVVPADAPVTESPKDPTKNLSWMVAQLDTNLRLIDGSIDYYGPELNIKGDAWIDAMTKKPGMINWPSCGELKGTPIDCFKVWGVRKPKNSIN